MTAVQATSLITKMIEAQTQTNALMAEQAVNNSMNNPAVYVAIFTVFGLLSLVTSLIVSRIKKNELGLENESIRRVNACAELEKKILTSTVSVIHCEGKQELWEAHSKAMMEMFKVYIAQNDLVHTSLLDELKREGKSRASQMAEVAKSIDVLSGCVKALELGKEC